MNLFKILDEEEDENIYRFLWWLLNLNEKHRDFFHFIGGIWNCEMRLRRSSDSTMCVDSPNNK